MGQRFPLPLHLPNQTILFQLKVLLQYSENLKPKVFIQRHIIRIMSLQGYHKLVLVSIPDDLIQQQGGMGIFSEWKRMFQPRDLAFLAGLVLFLCKMERC